MRILADRGGTGEPIGIVRRLGRRVLQRQQAHGISCTIAPLAELRTFETAACDKVDVWIEVRRIHAGPA